MIGDRPFDIARPQIIEWDRAKEFTNTIIFLTD